MSKAFFRVDNRLVHGQVLECWAPVLGVDRIFVVDEELANDPFQKCAIEGLGQGLLDIRVMGVDETVENSDVDDPKTMFLFAGLEAAHKAMDSGLTFTELNLGNIHPSNDCNRLNPSVCLSAEDIAGLRELIDRGVEVTARAVPSDPTPDVGEFIDGLGQ